MSKPAETDHPIHELLANRWSPVGYSDRAVSPDDLRSLFEAVRWAASSYNEQPWSFLVATKDDEAAFGKLLSCLVDGNQPWARTAPVLVLGVTCGKFKRNDKPNSAAEHDLGLAAGNLCVEATARGLAVHQMIGILPDKARELYAIPEGHDALTALAIGYIADPANLSEDLRARDLAPRSRKPLREFVFGGAWGTTSTLVT